MILFPYITPFVIKKLNSPLNGEIKVVERFWKRTLLVNGAEQSGGTITGMWEKAIKKISNFKFQISNCLILGLGGGTIIKILQKHYPGLAIEVVEFDPMIIEIAQKYFDIKSSPQLKIIRADAFSWIKTTKMKYDLVISDLYLGKFNPNKSREIPFLKDLNGLLSPTSFILFNAHYQNDEAEYKKLFGECKKMFLQAKLILSYPYSRILFLGN